MKAKRGPASLGAAVRKGKARGGKAGDRALAREFARRTAGMSGMAPPGPVPAAPRPPAADRPVPPGIESPAAMMAALTRRQDRTRKKSGK